MNDKLKKHEVFRLIIQVLSFAFHNGYIKGWQKGEIYVGPNKRFCMPGLNCYSCPGAVGACPIGSLQAVLDSGSYKFSCYVIGFIAMIGLFCGRFVCGWLCPFGLVQDLVYRIPVKNKVKNLPGHSYLRYLRYAILLVFVIILPATILNVAGSGSPWYCAWICPSGTLLGGIPLTIAQESLREAAKFRFLWKIILLIIVLVASAFSYRPFCKYVCPLGALYGLANPVSIYRLKVDKEKCVQCGSCQRACGMDIKVWETPNSPDCIRCGKCKTACPKGAITTTFESLVAKTQVNVPNNTEAVTEPAGEANGVPAKRNRSIFITGLILAIGPAIAVLNHFIEVILVAKDSIDTIAKFIAVFSSEVAGLFILSFTILIGIRLIRASKNSDDIPSIHKLSIRGIIYVVLTLVISFLIASVAEFISNSGSVNLGYIGDQYMRNLIQFPSVIALLALAAFVTREKKSK